MLIRSAESEDPILINREIIYEVFKLITIPQCHTDEQTDRQTDDLL